MTGVRSWVVSAECAQPWNRALPWIKDRVDVGRHDAVEMERVCASCPVRQLCTTEVDDASIRAGFWAGQFRDPVRTSRRGARKETEAA